MELGQISRFIWISTPFVLELVLVRVVDVECVRSGSSETSILPVPVLLVAPALTVLPFFTTVLGAPVMLVVMSSLTVVPFTETSVTMTSRAKFLPLP